MPGLTQLEKFSENLLSLGNEPEIRSSNGEPRPLIPLPTGIDDTDDSDDFIFGLPGYARGETPPETAEQADSDLDDFFSSLGANDVPSASASGGSADAAGSDAADLLSGLFPAEEPDVRDFSAKSAISPAAAGSAQSPADLTPSPSDTPDFSFDELSLPDFPSADSLAPLQSDETAPETDFSGGLSDLPDFPDFSDTADGSTASNDTPDFTPPSGDELDMSVDFEEAPPVPPEPAAQKKSPEKAASPEPESAAFSDLSGGLGADAELSALLDNVENMFDFPSSDSTESLETDDFAEPADDLTSGFSLGDAFKNTDFTPDSLESSDPFDSSEGLPADIEADEENAFPDFDLSNMDFEIPGGADASAGGFDDDLPSADSLPSLDDLHSSSADFPDIGSLDFTPDESLDFTPGESLDFTPGESLDFTPGESLDFTPDESLDFTQDKSLDFTPGDSLDFTPDGSMDFSIPEGGGAPVGPGIEGLPDDIAADFDFSESSSGNGAAAEPGDSSDFVFNFELPVETPKKRSSSDALSAKMPEESAAAPNEFTSSEYKRFLENLQFYPLNVRIALEEVIVENQFTDEVVSDLIRRVIKKAPPRQFAAHLSKLTDKSITVPRDFEKRTAEQYAAYKQSIEYQLKNRVLPALCIVLVSLGLGVLFGFLVNTFVYRPLYAEMLYSQGYKLLETEAYQQAEQKFAGAVSKKPKLHWFLRYADGYRAHKQFERARRVYESGLGIFSNDKRIGLAYANMELNDLANYEQAEKIIRRNILDFYINDKDGLLLLGDVFLEWATEKDPQKFENARQQYAQLMSLYGQTDLYLSRMMRYFIRTDNLREVLPLKSYFLPKKKALGAPDLVELSGYLLDKLYGPLDPAEEYLRAYIEDVRTLLERAAVADPSIPEAHYNFGKYFLHTGNSAAAKSQFTAALSTFTSAVPRNSRRVVKNIDAFRFLGDLYCTEENYIDAERMYAQGISMYQKEKDISSLSPNRIFGKLYASMGDIDYFISGDYDSAFANYISAIQNVNDTPEIRYKVGYIQYGRQNYQEALGSFISASTGKPSDRNVLYSLGNVLFLRNDDFAAQGYYERLMQLLDADRVRMGVLFPQVNAEQGDLVTSYMKTSNNLGAILYRVAQRSGDSSKNARAMVCFSESVRARDALTRNQTTMVRLDGPDLAAQNLKYAASPMPSFQPGIYTDIPPVMMGDRVLRQTSLGK